MKQSLCIWNLLIKIPFNELNKLKIVQNQHVQMGDIIFVQVFYLFKFNEIKDIDWLVDKNRSIVSPSKITIDELSLEYNVNKMNQSI